MLLVAVTLLSLPGTAFAATQSFPDITDSATEENVAVLQMLGVINGSGGKFHPDDSLTRAEYCKMAIIIMGRGEEEALYRSRTIFPDVRSTHWARGYINLAASGDDRIIRGNSDGTFKPDNSITYAEAVTILVRVLGYTDADAGMLWPAGYINLAADIGLTSGITGLGNNSAISRKLAARLFRNLLETKTKAGPLYMDSLGSATTDVVFMGVDATTADGRTGAIKTSSGTFTPASGVQPVCFLGQRGTLLVNAKGQALTFIPSSEKSVTITVASAGAGVLRATSGKEYTIDPSLPAYTSEKSGTYGELFIDIQPGMSAIIYYTNDVPSGVYVSTARSTDAIVVGDSVSTTSFSSITGGATNFSVIKNGYPSSMLEIEKYDVATYNSASNSLIVSDSRLIAYYENVTPSVDYPTKITIMGQDFSVLPSAVPSLKNIKLGTVATFLLTSDSQIAGAVASTTIRNTAIGTVNAGSTAEDISVTLFNGLEVSGAAASGVGDVSGLVGEIVTVRAPQAGKLTVAKLTGSNATWSFDIDAMKFGTAATSPALRVYERVGAGAMTPIDLESVALKSVPAAKISFAHLDQKGRLDIIVFDDVTGDLYEYGLVKLSVETVEDTFTDENNNTTNYKYNVNKVSVSNRNAPTGTTQLIYASDENKIPKSGFIGIAARADGVNLLKFVTLTSATISRSSFKTVGDKTYATVNGTDILVSENVQCQNKITGSWFASLSDARAFSDNVTVYYDKTPSEGGKIRIVTAG